MSTWWSVMKHMLRHFNSVAKRRARENRDNCCDWLFFVFNVVSSPIAPGSNDVSLALGHWSRLWCSLLCLCRLWSTEFVSGIRTSWMEQELFNMRRTSHLTFIILQNQIAAPSKCSGGMLINQLYQNKLAPAVKLKWEHSMLQKNLSTIYYVNSKTHLWWGTDTVYNIIKLLLMIWIASWLD